MAIRDIPSKAAKDCLEVLKQILDDLSARCASQGNRKPRGLEILLRIKNTMSDRASTEVKFNELLEIFINETIPLMKEAEEEELLEGEDEAAVVRLNEFFCGLHSLVHFTNSAVEAQKEWEKSSIGAYGLPLFNPQCARPGESGGSRMVQAACKAFAFEGDNKNGCATTFMTEFRPILEKKCGSSKNPFQKFLGARFNILGRNAVYLYCLRSQLKDFLKLTATNMLLKSVLFDLDQPGTMAEVRTLGMLSKLIFVPLWNVLEDKNISIAAMRQIYEALIRFFDAAAKDPTSILEGQSPFEEKYIDRDVWMTDLLTCDDTTDCLTAAIMTVIMQTLSVFARRQFRDHLADGVHENLTDEQSPGVPKTNRKCESYFGFWDHELRRVPNISSIAVEAKLLWVMNRTSDWLDNKSAEERNAIIEEARKQAVQMRKTFKEREKDLMKAREEALQKKREAIKAKEEQEAKKRTELGKEIDALGGMWKSVEEMKVGLEKVRANARGEGKGKLVQALKCQISYRRLVAKQPVRDAKEWNYTGANGKIDVEGLTSKLVNIINQFPNPTQQPTPQPATQQ